MNNRSHRSSLFQLDPIHNTMMATKYVILMLCFAVVRISATPKGAPEEACESLTPKHGDAKPQTTNSPYNVKVHEADCRNCIKCFNAFCKAVFFNFV